MCIMTKYRRHQSGEAMRNDPLSATFSIMLRTLWQFVMAPVGEYT